MTGRQHQAEERVAPRHQLGSRRLRRVPLRRLARHRQGAVRGRGRAVAKKETKLEYAAGLETSTRTSSELSEQETDFLPITTQGVPLPVGHAVPGAGDGRVHRGADLQLDLHRRAAGQGEFATSIPTSWNPYGALPQMRLLTYQMPDELLAIASQGEFDEFDLNEFFAATGTGDERRVQAQERRPEVARHHPRRLLRRPRSTT